MRVPSSTPGGMLTESVRSRVTRPGARAARAGIVDHLAAALTGRAGALEREEALRMAHAAGAAAGRTGLRLGAGLGARTGAGLAGDRGRQPHLRGLALERLLQVDLHVVAKIGAALAARGAAAAAPAAHAENAFEDIGEGGAEIGAEAGPAAHAALLEGGVAETVIGGALVAVLQNVVGLVDFLELVLALGVAGIAIRVMLHGELAEGRLEVDLGAFTGNTQDFIVVALGHAASFLASPTRS